MCTAQQQRSASLLVYFMLRLQFAAPAPPVRLRSAPFASHTHTHTQTRPAYMCISRDTFADTRTHTHTVAMTDITTMI